MGKKLNLDTICVQGGWKPTKGESRVLPIYQSTTFKYDTTEEMGRLFDLEDSGYFYTRLANPTNDAVAAKIAELEGGTQSQISARQETILSVLLRFMEEHLIFLLQQSKSLVLIVHLLIRMLQKKKSMLHSRKIPNVWLVKQSQTLHWLFSILKKWQILHTNLVCH